MRTLARAARAPQPGPLPATQTDGLQVTPAGRVLVDVYVDGSVDAARRALGQQGMQVTSDSETPGQHVVSGWLPAARAPDVAALGLTRSVVSVLHPRLNGVGPGSVSSLGDLRMRGPTARSASSVDGGGVTVGVISDSFNVLGGVAAAKSSSDLPPNITILDEGPPDGSDEGQAMGQLLYDTAPGVTNMLFATGFAGSASAKAANITKLVDAGARVITDDTAFIDQPFFQDGVVEQAVDEARDRGVAYFAAAGNSARNAWEGDFRSSGSFVAPGQERNDFDPSGAVDTRQSLGTAAAGDSILVISQWDEPWNQTLANSFTLRVFADSTLVATSTNASKIPEVDAQYVNNSGTPKTVSIELVRTGSGPAPRLKSMFYPDYTGPFTVGHDTQSPTIGPDAPAAAGAISVAAVDEADPGLDTPESFSSRGPLTHHFDAAGVRQIPPLKRDKPEIAAPDGGGTTVFGFGCLRVDRRDCFFGTSAASPAAAGVAALLWSANPALPLAQLRSAITDPANTVDCLPTVGPDDDCGAGFLLADQALAAIDRTPPVVTAVVDPPAPDGDGGWYHSDVDVSWTHTDPDTPISIAGCDTTTITTDSVRTLPCAVTSAGGTTSVPVTVRRDATPPSAPTITGITARTYTTATLPATGAITCQATDAASGLAGCTVAGYDATIGTHRLTATATDRSGLGATATLDYTVTAVPPTPPRAASRLSLARLSLGTLRTRGLRVSVRTARPATKLAVTLTARLPGARRSSTVGRLTRTVGAAGTRSLRVTLSRRARTALARARTVSVSATVVATASGATKATLKASRSFRR